MISISTVLILTASLTFIFTLVAIIVNRNLKNKSYDEVNKKIAIDDVRSNLEKQIYILNDRLVQNEERWKDVNHLLLRKQFLDERDSVFADRKMPYSDFLRSNGILESDLQPEENLVFVLTPFHDGHAEEFMAIRDVCANAGYRCIRGDEVHFDRDIFPQMLKYIVKAKLVIANINGRNANVMYELGIAHALDKAVLHVSRKPENLPIDIRTKKFFVYEKLEDLQTFIREELLEAPKK